MTELNLGHLISKFVNYRAINAPKNIPDNKPVQQAFNPAPTAQTATAQSISGPMASPRMANMAGADQSVYVKEMMNLPKNLNELLYILQRNITLAQFNQQFAKQIAMQRSALSQTQAQILAQLQGLSLTEAQNMILTGNKAILSQIQNSIKNLAISSCNIIKRTYKPFPDCINDSGKWQRGHCKTYYGNGKFRKTRHHRFNTDERNGKINKCKYCCSITK